MYISEAPTLLTIIPIRSRISCLNYPGLCIVSINAMIK